MYTPTPQSNLKLQLYAYGSDKPVFETDTPIFAKGQEQHEPNLTWLALCLDGKKGLDSLDSPSVTTPSPLTSLGILELCRPPAEGSMVPEK